MKIDRILKDSFKCPLNPIMSMHLSPRGILEVKNLFEEGLVSEDTFRKLIMWCDLCGLCDMSFEYVKDTVLSLYEREDPHLEIEVLHEGIKHIIIPYELYATEVFKSVIEGMVDKFSELGFDYGLVVYKNFPSIYFKDVFLGRKYSLVKPLLEKGLNDLIVLDKYSYQILKTPKLAISSISWIVSDIITMVDVYPIKMSPLTIHLLNTRYKFYRAELIRMFKVIRLIPYIKIQVSRRRYGFALAGLDSDLLGFITKYLDIRIPNSTYILSTVDPLVYTVFGGGLYKRFAISFLPFLILNIFRKY